LRDHEREVIVIEVVRPGPLATVQDLGRPGFAHLGVPHSGAVDQPSLRLANRLVGNSEGAAGLELTFGGASLRFHRSAWIAATGAPVPMTIGGRPVGMNAPCHVPAGSLVDVGSPACGVRTYVGISGGLAVEPVLGSRSADLLSGLGPPALSPGDRLSLGPSRGEITVDVAPVRAAAEVPTLRIVSGPRDDWFDPAARATLTSETYEVTAQSNRVGVRLSGLPLIRARTGELASEGMVTGALQVPPDGLPIIFLADHPTTGGYPVIAVLTSADLPIAAQLRPGQQVRFHLA
jgi:biotin-dependent carboxylase-like uncharacterized protein